MRGLVSVRSVSPTSSSYSSKVVGRCSRSRPSSRALVSAVWPKVEDDQVVTKDVLKPVRALAALRMSAG